MPHLVLVRSAVPITALAITGLIQSACARDSDVGWLTRDEDRAWLHTYDPTLLSPRLLSELSYQDLSHDQSLIKLETTLRGAYTIHENLAFGLQMMVPMDWKDIGTTDKSGLGDLQFRTGIVGRISPTLRCGFGVNATFDTASDSALGSSALILRPITAIRWDASDRLNLGFQAEYNFTPWDEGFDEVSALELKLQLALKFTDNWSSALTYKPRWNFLDEDSRQRLDAGVTRTWGSEHQYALSFSTEVPLATDSLNWKFTTGFTWYF